MTAENSTQDLLPAELTMGTVMLKVGDMKVMTDYYQRALGLDVVAEQDGGLYLGRLQKPLVHLAPAPGLHLPAGARPASSTPPCCSRTRPPSPPPWPRAAQFEPQLLHGQRRPPRQRGLLLQRSRRQRHRALLGPAPRRNWSWDGTDVVMDSLALPPQRYLEQHLTEESVTGQRETEAGVGPRPPAGRRRPVRPGLLRGHPRVRKDRRLARAGAVRLRRRLPPPHGHERLEQPRRRPRRDTLGLGEVLIEVPSGDDVGALADRLKTAGVQSHHTGAELRFEDPWRNRIRVAVR